MIASSSGRSFSTVFPDPVHRHVPSIRWESSGDLVEDDPPRREAVEEAVGISLREPPLERVVQAQVMGVPAEFLQEEGGFPGLAGAGDENRGELPESA